MNIQTLFYKTHLDFAREYDIGVDYIKEYLTDTVLGSDSPRATVVGMTELQLLKKLGLFEPVDEFNEEDDPRNQVYILYIYSNI